MNNRFVLRLQAAWQTLTEVPGWPDAPRGMRIRRALPVVVPLFSVLLVAIWHLGVTRPALRAERASFAPVVQLEQDIAGLAALCSEEEAAEWATRGAAAQKQLLDTPAQAAVVLDEVSRALKARGWEGTLQALPVDPDAPRPEGALFYFVPAKGKFQPSPGNQEPFASLLAATEQLSAASKRIELTRLAVRADEQGRQAVEVHLRLACRYQP